MDEPLRDRIRNELPAVIKEKIRTDKPDHFDLSDIATRLAVRLGRRQPDRPLDQAIMDIYFDLFRSGLVSFGLDIGNAQITKFRFTDAGKLFLEDAEQAPENPVGYLLGLPSTAGLSGVGQSYLDEALRVFGSGHHRAAAVLLGAVVESTVFGIRDAFLAKLSETGETPPSSLTKKDATAKQVYETLDKALTERKHSMPPELVEAFESHWYSFLNDIRLSRNDSGHPKTITPVTRDDVRAGFLQLRSIARVAAALRAWITAGLKV